MNNNKITCGTGNDIEYQTHIRTYHQNVEERKKRTEKTEGSSCKKYHWYPMMIHRWWRKQKITTTATATTKKRQARRIFFSHETDSEKSDSDSDFLKPIRWRIRIRREHLSDDGYNTKNIKKSRKKKTGTKKYSLKQLQNTS